MAEAVVSDIPIPSDDRTLHVTVKKGEVANRILAVGDTERALRLSRLLDNPNNKIVVQSKLGCVVYTDTFRGVPVSIIGTGMGIPMTDLVVRECRHVVEGKMAIVRYGTCGVLQKDIKVGTVISSTFSRCIQQNYDYDPSDGASQPYRISKRVPADPELSQLVTLKLRTTLPPGKVVERVGYSAETFYSAQGRRIDQFEDFNDDLLERLTTEEPEAGNLEMETFKLLHLAKCSKGSIKAAGAAIGLINRKTEEVLPEAELKDLEVYGGYAILKALIEVSLD